MTVPLYRLTCFTMYFSSAASNEALSEDRVGPCSACICRAHICAASSRITGYWPCRRGTQYVVSKAQHSRLKQQHKNGLGAGSLWAAPCPATLPPLFSERLIPAPRATSGDRFNTPAGSRAAPGCRRG